MYVLDCEECSHCISWTPPSTKSKSNKVFFQDSFTVSDVDAFASEVMPLLFKEAKYESFQRALYRWGFIKSHRKTKKDSIDGKQRSFTYHHTGNMFAKNDWEKCSVLSYSKTLKSAKDMISKMSYIGVTLQPLDVEQRRVSLTYDTATEIDAGKQRGLGCLPEVPSIFSSPLETLQTRDVRNPNLLALNGIYAESQPRLDTNTLMPRPRFIPSSYHAVQSLANSEYANSILERAYQVLANDTNQSKFEEGRITF